jgi:hypothetical protein
MPNDIVQVSERNLIHIVGDDNVYVKWSASSAYGEKCFPDDDNDTVSKPKLIDTAHSQSTVSSASVNTNLRSMSRRRRQNCETTRIALEIRRLSKLDRPAKYQSDIQTNWYKQNRNQNHAPDRF